MALQLNSSYAGASIIKLI